MSGFSRNHYRHINLNLSSERSQVQANEYRNRYTNVHLQLVQVKMEEYHQLKSSLNVGLLTHRMTFLIMTTDPSPSTRLSRPPPRRRMEGN